MTLDDRLRNNEIVILDGAIGSEIERLGAKMDNAAWCGVANKTHPETVRKVHEEYLRWQAQGSLTKQLKSQRKQSRLLVKPSIELHRIVT